MNDEGNDEILPGLFCNVEGEGGLSGDLKNFQADQK